MKLILILGLALSSFSATRSEEKLLVIPSISVCVAEPLFMGEYIASKEVADGVPTYSNANDMSFFRNNGFWYLGDLNVWPPATHYRCVEMEGCNQEEDFPPSTTDGVWTASKIGKLPVPIITNESCVGTSEQSLDIQNDEL